MDDNDSFIIANGNQMLPTQLVDDVKLIVERGLCDAYRETNFVLVKTYWNVGKRIVEEEQHGNFRAKYGKHLIDMLSKELSLVYPKGYSPRNLRDYRQFYLCFKDLEIWHSRVPNLTWTHYRTLLSVTDDDARYSVLHDNKQLYAAKYLTYLPTEEVLKREIERQKEIFYLQNKQNQETSER